MISKLAKPLRFLAWAVTAESTPRRVAWGFAIGAMIGLVPKDNLIALALITLLFAIRVNILAGLVGAFVFSMIATVITPFLDHMGASVLAITPFQNFYAQLFEMPLGAWTRFNNTVVAGGLIVGLLQLIPLYCLTKAIVAKRIDRWRNTCQATELGRTLLHGNPTTAGTWRIG